MVSASCNETGGSKKLHDTGDERSLCGERTEEPFHQVDLCFRDAAVAVRDPTIALSQTLHQLVIQCSDVPGQPRFQLSHITFGCKDLCVQAVALVDGPVKHFNKRACSIGLHADGHEGLEESDAK